jgi:hypothetical protein
MVRSVVLCIEYDNKRWIRDIEISDELEGFPIVASDNFFFGFGPNAIGGVGCGVGTKL